jgi:hypothetical protein
MARNEHVLVEVLLVKQVPSGRKKLFEEATFKNAEKKFDKESALLFARTHYLLKDPIFTNSSTEKQFLFDPHCHTCLPHLYAFRE